MIIIRPRPGETIADVLRLLRDLADDASTVRTGGGGVIVGEELAYDYLTAILNKIPVTDQVPVTGQLAVDPAVEPASGAPQDPAPPSTPTARPGPRRQAARKTAAAKTPGGVS